MNIQPVKVGSRKWSDIRLQRKGCGSVKKSIVKRFGLEQKRVIFALDMDDKKHEYLYMIVDAKGNKADSILLTKAKQGGFIFGLGALKKVMDDIPGAGGIGYYYYKKMVEKEEVYFQFKREGRE